MDYPSISISNINIRFLPSPKGNLLAFVSVILNGAIVLSNIGVHIHRNGDLGVSFPARTRPDGSREYYYAPLNEDVRKLIESAIAKKYLSLTGGGD